MLARNIIIALLFASLIYVFGDIRYKSGYEAAEDKYTPVIEQYKNLVNTKIAVLETLSESLLTENRNNTNILNKNISTIITNTKAKPLVVIKEGGCVPSQEFSDSFVLINKKVNESFMRGVK